MRDEAREAAFYQEHKDDPEVWGDPVEAPAAPRRSGLGTTITVRFSVDEAELIRGMAKNTGLTYSEVVRQACDAYLRPRVTIAQGQENPIFQQPPSVVQVAETVLEMARGPEAITATAGQLPPALTKTG